MPMNTGVQNPYLPPQADVVQADEDEFAEVPFFGVSGRIGRLRYIAYSLLVTVGMMMVAGVLAGVVSALPGSGRAAAGGLVAIIIAFYLAMFIYYITLTIRRAHDFNTSGWLAILIIVPFVNFLFWFVPGTPETNNYGLRPEPNKTWVTVVAIGALLVVPAMGILAAIALPAYQDYTQRAKTFEAYREARQAANAVREYYLAQHNIPPSLEAAGYSPQNTSKQIRSIDLDPETGVLTVNLAFAANKSLILSPSVDQGQIRWVCSSETVRVGQLPKECRK